MNETPLTINIESFSPKNEVRARGIETTLKSVFEVFLKEFGTKPDASVNVAWWGGQGLPPRTLFDHRPFEIRLTAIGNNWPQYVYQFAHELCHAMTNFDLVREHKHKWFEESLCELASLFVLEKLAEVWAADPPAGIKGSQSWASLHATYAREVACRYDTVPRSDLPTWLQANISTMEESSTERDLNGIVSFAFLPSFRRDPSLWRDCVWLNFWDARNNGTFAEYLDSWDSCLRSRESAHNKTPAFVRALLFSDEELSNRT